MRSLRPPSLATWLLHKFGCGNDALSGDLLEEYSHGRSGAWFWRQVLAAIFIGFGKEVRTHKLIALRAVVIGWLASYFFHVVELPWWRSFTKLLLAHGVTPTPWWQHYYFYPILFVPCIFAAATGWIVGRSHRGHRGAMVLAYLASVLLWNLPEFVRLTVDVATNQRFLPYLLSGSVRFMLVAVSILLGGLWETSTSAT
jgi:hypothetical protein